MYKKLPVETICLNLSYKPLGKTEYELRQMWLNNKPNKVEKYISATCHYVQEKGERTYYTQKNTIKRALYMSFYKDDKNYPAYVYDIEEYGLQKKPFNKELEENVAK